MKILVYEHFTAAARADDDLRREGGSMLAALALDLARAGHAVSTVVAREAAFPWLATLERAGVRVATHAGNGLPETASGAAPVGEARPDATFDEALRSSHAAWIIAPESGGRLAALARAVLDAGRELLGSAPEAVALAGSKQRTFARLLESGVPAVPTAALREPRLAPEAALWDWPLVIKPDDGVGCEGVGLAWNVDELETAWARARRTSACVLAQPFVPGPSASVVLLVTPAGRAFPCSVQSQEVRHGRAFHYGGGRMPLEAGWSERARDVARAACEAIPGLAGLVGVDLIVGSGGPLVMEVNPRLTTSYIGLRRAIRENPAELALRAIAGELPERLSWRAEVRFTPAGEVVERELGALGREDVDLRVDDNGNDRRPDGAPGSGCVGWDIGGANLKAVRLDIDGSVSAAEQPFELWRAPASLPRALAELAARLGCAPGIEHAVTMTGELADCFPSKREGVRAILASVREAFPEAPLHVYALPGCFVSVAQAGAEPLAVAGANWSASARWLALGELAAQLGPWDVAILVDVGSTTTDVVAFRRGEVLARGRTDPERLLEGELVYTGAQRTPICAVLRTVPLQGRECPIAAETFAIAADAHVWLGALSEAEYGCPTPDGGPATRSGAATRLARVVCGDLDLLTREDVSAIALRVSEAQVESIARALRRVATRVSDRDKGSECRVGVLSTGSGAWLAEAAAAECGLRVQPLEEQLGMTARTLPALAAAKLLRMERLDARETGFDLRGRAH